MLNSPPPGPGYPSKSRAIGVTVNAETIIYPFDELAREGDQVVVEDEIGGLPVLVVLDVSSATAVVFSRLINGSEHHFFSTEPTTDR